jgi:hypothetical protein
MKPYYVKATSLKQLQRISPSRFYHLDNCSLREVWNADKEVGHMLPLPLQSYFGTLTHYLIEQVLIGNIKDFNSIEERWEEQLNNFENMIKRSWFEDHLIPLRHNLHLYEVKRQQCLKILETQISRITQFNKRERVGQRQKKCGVWLESEDHIIGGIIDEIRQNTHNVQLVDYKSGIVLDHDTFQIKPEYIVQLKLYAALYFENYNHWPNTLTIIQINGSEIDIPFSEKECLSLYQEAKYKFHKVNQLISNNVDAMELATPSSLNCRFCNFRPGCVSYQFEMQNISDKWSYKDLAGTIVEREQLGNGKQRILIKTYDDNYFYVRGISNRHIALQENNLKNLQIFNLSRDVINDHFKENNYTTIYVKSSLN